MIHEEKFNWNEVIPQYQTIDRRLRVKDLLSNELLYEHRILYIDLNATICFNISGILENFKKAIELLSPPRPFLSNYDIYTILNAVITKINAGVDNDNNPYIIIDGFVSETKVWQLVLYDIENIRSVGDKLKYFLIYKNSDVTREIDIIINEDLKTLYPDRGARHSIIVQLISDKFNFDESLLQTEYAYMEQAYVSDHELNTQIYIANDKGE